MQVLSGIPAQPSKILPSDALSSSMAHHRGPSNSPLHHCCVSSPIKETIHSSFGSPSLCCEGSQPVLAQSGLSALTAPSDVGAISTGLCCILLSNAVPHVHFVPSRWRWRLKRCLRVGHIEHPATTIDTMASAAMMTAPSTFAASLTAHRLCLRVQLMTSESQGRSCSGMVARVSREVWPRRMSTPLLLIPRMSV